MMDLSVFNLFLFIALTWGTNILLNFLYVIKRYAPSFREIDRSLDGGVLFIDKRPLLGESTTVLGLALSFLISVFIARSGWYPITIALYTPLLVYGGHALGSFVKRRIGVGEGSYVPLLDHGDYILVSGGVLAAFGWISLSLWTAALAFTYIFHPIACVVAFRLKLREHPY